MLVLGHGCLDQIEIHKVFEDNKSMDKNRKSELISRLSVLIANLLKWHYNPHNRNSTWNLIVKHERSHVNKLLIKNQSLKDKCALYFTNAYECALTIAANETGMMEEEFPKQCPFTLADCLDHNFLPDLLS